MVRAVGVAAEASPNSGTYVVPDYYFDPMSERIQLNENVLIPDTISTPTGRRAFLTHQDSSGQVEFILDTTVASYFLSAVCGQSTTTTGTTTIELVPTAERKTLPAVSVTINSLYFLRKIAGAGIKRVTIRSDGGPGNLPMLQVEFVGGTETKHVVDTNLNVSSFTELGKVLANTTGWLYLADDDDTVTNKSATGLLKAKNFEVVIEPTFKEDPIIGIDGLDPELYYPENWRIRITLSIPYTAESTKWMARYMGSQQDPDVDGIGGDITRVWDLLNEDAAQLALPIQFRAYFEYDANYNLQIDVRNSIIIEPPEYNEEGKTIRDVSLTLEGIHYDNAGVNETFQAVIDNSSDFDGSLLPGDESI